MRKIARATAFALLIIGTLGLLVNELVFDWGRVATIFLAVLNVIGLILICFAAGGGGNEQEDKSGPD